MIAAALALAVPFGPFAPSALDAQAPTELDAYDLVWTSPSRDASQSGSSERCPGCS